MKRGSTVACFIPRHMAVILLLGFAMELRAAEPVTIVAGPMFTVTGNDEITVWLQTNRPARLRFETHCHWMGKDDRDAFDAAASNRNCVTLKLKVRAGAIYGLKVYEKQTASEASTANAEPIICLAYRCPPPDGKSGLSTFAFGSCSHQEKFGDSQPIWTAIAKERPDCFLFIGDNIYLPNRASDYQATREEVLRLYCDTYDRERRVPEMQSLLRSTMSFALWDDHDYGPNNSDRTWPWKDVALEALKLYFPNNYGLPDAPGCYYRFAWGDIDVFMLDDRTYRDPNRDENRTTFLGARQLAWLKDGLAASKSTFKLVACGNQILSDTHPHESWGVQFRPERDAFLDWLWEKKITGVLFVAGDRHFAELVRKPDPKKRGPDLWELTSSPLANDHYKDGPSFKNPERVACYAGGVNYGLLEFNTVSIPERATLSIKDVKGATVFQRTITLQGQELGEPPSTRKPPAPDLPPR